MAGRRSAAMQSTRDLEAALSALDSANAFLVPEPLQRRFEPFFSRLRANTATPQEQQMFLRREFEGALSGRQLQDSRDAAISLRVSARHQFVATGLAVIVDPEIHVDGLVKRLPSSVVGFDEVLSLEAGELPVRGSPGSHAAGGRLQARLANVRWRPANQNAAFVDFETDSLTRFDGIVKPSAAGVAPSAITLAPMGVTVTLPIPEWHGATTDRPPHEYPMALVDPRHERALLDALAFMARLVPMGAAQELVLDLWVQPGARLFPTVLQIAVAPAQDGPWFPVMALRVGVNGEPLPERLGRTSELRFRLHEPAHFQALAPGGELAGEDQVWLRLRSDRELVRSLTGLDWFQQVHELRRIPFSGVAVRDSLQAMGRSR